MGVFVGANLMYLILKLTDSGEPEIKSLLTPAGTATATATTATIEQDGWYTIHVFYHSRQGLQVPHDPATHWFSQVHQDQAVMDLLGGKDGGYFIDLAANHAWDLSNTLALEARGWNGLCIEPNPMYWYGLSHRKCTVIGALVGGPQIQQVKVKFRGVYGGIAGRMDDTMAKRKREPDVGTEQRYTTPFPELLQQYNVPKVIDYLSLDVEGAEYLVMQYFPFEEYIIKLVSIERPSEELKNLLEKNGYLFLKDLAWWGETLVGTHIDRLYADASQSVENSQ